ncbi:MAG TPA: hypothetical protein VF440_10870 [Novosphingobium sp.]
MGTIAAITIAHTHALALIRSTPATDPTCRFAQVGCDMADAGCPMPIEASRGKMEARQPKHALGPVSAPIYSNATSRAPRQSQPFSATANRCRAIAAALRSGTVAFDSPNGKVFWWGVVLSLGQKNAIPAAFWVAQGT